MYLDTASFSNLPPITISSELQRARDLALAQITPAVCRQPIKSTIITWSLVNLFKASLSTFKFNTPSLHSDSSVEACSRRSVKICPLESQTIKHCSQLRWHLVLLLLYLLVHVECCYFDQQIQLLNYERLVSPELHLRLCSYLVGLDVGFYSLNLHVNYQ